MADTRTSDRARTGRHPADLVETGNLLRTQPDTFPAASLRQPAEARPERHDVVVIGAGQAGLSVSYHLKRRGIDHVILEGAPRVGDVWRNRWDSLRLFTPAKFDSLDGYRFPAHKDTFPTKDEMADYLEAYAAKFDLPVRVNEPVRRLHKANGRFRLETKDRVCEADRVVVAAASYQKPRLPALANDLDPQVFQMHSHEYRNPAQLPNGPVLLVGAGNSGAEIAMDLAKTHKVYLSGRDVGHIPFDPVGFLGRKLLVRLVIRGLFHRILTMRTPMGRKFRSRMHGHGMPLIRTRPGQLKRAGVRRIGKIARIRDGKAVADDGAEVAFASVIWCTGFDPGFDWIDLPVLDGRGDPRHRFGKSTDVAGLYFAGLHFQYAVSSPLVSGVGRDARRVVGWIDAARNG
ncbi:oxidoreductase [Mesorhizobium sp. L-8-10]|uniref:flavin-containing monooxygenase n=1 Tax=unclassified Mesorhizobium TaxID=325217 RepID=UPI001927E593|nr:MULTISPECIES: FAD-dependent oxidoreductase [unclassified Mesorhizobium]BCH24335.1 oxidoreductase [Mesorhizobium sp. L-8-3]BCH32066.1 oxidoreductase [Mesorhizobium sp. L-8-10]